MLPNHLVLLVGLYVQLWPQAVPDVMQGHRLIFVIK